RRGIRTPMALISSGTMDTSNGRGTPTKLRLTLQGAVLTIGMSQSPPIPSAMRHPQSRLQTLVRTQRRPKRAALFLFFLLIVAFAAAWVLPNAWRETTRREAYLPELEAQAKRSPYD